MQGGWGGEVLAAGSVDGWTKGSKEEEEEKLGEVGGWRMM